MVTETDASRDGPGERRAAWSRYWAAGALHSCTGSYGEAYGGRLGAFWASVFATLPDRARVLDIATGNGVVPRMLIAQRREAGISCDAIDVADVQLPWLKTIPAADRERVRLHGGVDAGSLPFADAVFDLVVSHYGFEYTDRERTLAEMLRVRAPAGGIAMVLHHAQGRPASLARAELGHFEWVLSRDGFLDAILALVEPLARGAAPAEDAVARNRERFLRARDELQVRARSIGGDVLAQVDESVTSALKAARPGEAGEAYMHVAALREELEAGAVRLRDLCAHTLDPDAAQALRGRIARALGREATLEELREEGGYLMGWGLRSR